MWSQAFVKGKEWVSQSKGRRYIPELGCFAWEEGEADGGGNMRTGWSRTGTVFRVLAAPGLLRDFLGSRIGGQPPTVRTRRDPAGVSLAWPLTVHFWLHRLQGCARSWACFRVRVGWGQREGERETPSPSFESLLNPDGRRQNQF